jgi:hypothetical protein
MFSTLNDNAVIDKLFTIAGYTYGPLLGIIFLRFVYQKNCK